MTTRTSIYHKLILYIFFLGIFVIVSVSLFSYITARNAILQRTYNQLTSLRIAKKEQVTQFFTDRLKEVELFSHLDNTGILSFNTKKLSGFISINMMRETLDANFTRFFRTGNYYSHVYILNNGHTEAYNLDSTAGASHSLTDEESLVLQPLMHQAIEHKSAVIRDYIRFPSDSTVHLYIVSPLFNANQPTSNAVVFEIKPSAVNNIMKNNEMMNGLGMSGEVYLVGPDSLIRSESRFIPNSILHLPVCTQSVHLAYQSLEGSHLIPDYRYVMVLSSYSRLAIPYLNWVIIAEIDKKEAMRPIYKLANEIVFLSIFIAFFLFLASYRISRTITRPIIELKNATIRVRNGDLGHPLNIKSKDEIGELTENFNLMTNQLNSQNIELKEREAHLFTSFIDGQEDERQRLARELHDGLGQMIIATKLKTENMMNTGDALNDHKARLRQMFDGLVDEVRGISNNLMPAVLQEFGLVMALEHICAEISRHSSINVIFDSQLSNSELDKRIATYTFRIAQEALNNAVKHANATEIIMTLFGNDKMINLMVQDDGIGINIDMPCKQSGRGLNSMCERVKLLNGLINISKGENHGTIVSVKIPLS